MSLMSINQVQEALDVEFGPLAYVVTGLRLQAPGASEADIAALEQRLNITLSPHFRHLIARYDFGSFTLGPVAFGNDGDYVTSLERLNSSESWWGSGPRPKNVLLIAGSDPYLIFLDTVTSSVLVADDEFGWPHVSCVAHNFELYLRGVGTIMLRREATPDKANFADSVSAEVGSDNSAYWAELAL